MKKFPPMIHNKAGSQPNVIPMNGPRIGPRAATLLNWYPQSTYRLTGKYSTPSMYMCAGVAFFAFDRHTFRSIHFPYPQYATPYNPIVTTTHRNGVPNISAMRLSSGPPGPPTPLLGGAATDIRVRALKRHVYRPRANLSGPRCRRRSGHGRRLGRTLVAWSPLRE